MFGPRLISDDTVIRFMNGRIAGLVTSAILSIASIILVFYPGLNFGIDFFRPALKLPIVGRVGVSETHRPQELADRDDPPSKSTEENTAGLR